jgi:hypothetical protein
VTKVSPARWRTTVATFGIAILLSGCSGGPSQSELARSKQVAAQVQAEKDHAVALKAATAKAAAAKAASDKAAKVQAAAVKAARVKAAKLRAAMRKAAAVKAAKVKADAARATSSRAAVPGGSVGRDANGFALGGPRQATSPANYDHPSRSDCLRFRDELRAWSNYQNKHRPASSTNYLPSSGDTQYLFVVCHLRY